MPRRKIRDSRWGMRAEHKSKFGGNRKRIKHPKVQRELSRTAKD